MGEWRGQRERSCSSLDRARCVAAQAELVIRLMPPDYKITNGLEEEEAALRERMIEFLLHAL
jgi:hypothetical protein